MATLQLRNNSYRVLFCSGGRRYTFTIGQVTQREAENTAAAAEDAARRLARQTEFEARRREQERQKAMEAPLRELCLLTDLLLFAALILAGFHRCHRGPWRRRRHERTN